MALTRPDPPPPAGPCAIAYKEWAGVCRALGEGRQTILLRKGGVAESGGVFRPEFTEFWMYPTHLHEAQQGLRDEFAAPPGPTSPGSVRLELRAVASLFAWVDDLDAALRLSEFHVLTEETVRKRFAYRMPGLWVLDIRAYRAASAVELPILPEHAGCRTWVPLDPAPAAMPLTPVLPDAIAAARREALAAALTQSNAAR
jgi:hypothetical protein